MNEEYFSKYLKYKSKYEKLKNQKGGVDGIIFKIYNGRIYFFLDQENLNKFNIMFGLKLSGDDSNKYIYIGTPGKPSTNFAFSIELSLNIKNILITFYKEKYENLIYLLHKDGKRIIIYKYFLKIYKNDKIDITNLIDLVNITRYEGTDESVLKKFSVKKFSVKKESFLDRILPRTPKKI